MLKFKFSQETTDQAKNIQLCHNHATKVSLGGKPFLNLVESCRQSNQ